MSAFLLVVVILISLFVYSVIGRWSYYLYYDRRNSLFDDNDAASICAVFWCVTLPVCGGIILAKWLIENEFGRVLIVSIKTWVDQKRKQSRD